MPHDNTESRAVSPLELFYDLVFVFALTQLSHHLLHDLTWRGAAETLVLLFAVFTVWIHTSYETTFFDITRRETQVAVLVAMALGLVMNAAISTAFTIGSWAFVIPLLLTQISRGIVTATRAPTPLLKEHYRHMLVWLLASAPLWVMGAAVEPEQRLWWWIAAAGIDVTGTWLAHPWPRRTRHTENVEFDSPHMAERLRLFLLIALGEAVLSTGVAIAESPNDPATLLAGGAAFATIACLWALYFGGSEYIVEEHIARTTDPLRSARMAANGAYLVVAALVAVAVGCDIVIAHPFDRGTPTLAALLFGGTLLYLATQTWYLTATTHQRFVSRWVSCAVLVATAPLTLVLPALASIALLVAVLLPVTATALRRRPLLSASGAADAAAGG